MFSKINKPVYYYCIWTIWIVVCYLTFNSCINVSVAVDHPIRKIVNYLLPEGWGFFTKDPREALVDVYTISSHGLQPLSMRNTDAANMLGISRKSRFIGYELSKAVGYIHKNQWKFAKGDLDKNIPPKAHPIQLKEYFKYFPKGEYLFVQYKQVPWAWANQNQEEFRPCLISRIKIL